MYICIISQHRNATGSWNFAQWNINKYLSSEAITMVVNVLASQGARVSADMVLV